MTSVYIAKDITTIGIRLLYNLDHVTKVEFEKGSKLEKIKAYGMGNMVNLRTLDLPLGLKDLYGSSFQSNVSGVKLTITIPKTVEMIGTDSVPAFKGVESLKLNVVEGSFAHTYAVNKGFEYFIPTVNDVDADGRVNLNDLITIAQYMADWDDLTVNSLALDVNGDGKIDLTDVTYLAQHLVGWYD